MAKFTEVPSRRRHCIRSSAILDKYPMAAAEFCYSYIRNAAPRRESR